MWVVGNNEGGHDKSHVRADVGRGGSDGGHEVDSGVHGGCL